MNSTSLRKLTLAVAGVLIGSAVAFADTAAKTVMHVVAAKEGAPLAIPADAPAQTVKLNWVVPKDRPAFRNILNRLGSKWQNGVLNLGSVNQYVVHPNGNEFQDGKAFTAKQPHLLVLHYNLTGGATLTPSTAAFAAPDSPTYPLTGSGWFYEVTSMSNGYGSWWDYAANDGSGTIDAAYMVNVNDMIEAGVVPDLSIGRLVELFGGRKLLPGTDGEAVKMPRNAEGQIVQTLTVTDRRGIVRKIEHAADEGETTFVLYPGDKLSIDYGSVAFRAALPVAADLSDDDWSPYLWVAAGDSLSDPSLNPVGGKYYDLLGESRGIRVSVCGKGSSGHWALSDSGLCYSQRLLTIPADADIVTVFGSINDWKYRNSGVELGEMTDSLSETKTIAAYLNETIKVVREKAPLARIVMMTGLYYYGAGNSYADNCYQMLKDIIQAKHPDIRFINWYEGQNAQGYEFPNANDYEFKQIDYTKYGEEFGAKYTRDFSTSGGAFGHPSAAYNKEWLGPAFEVELGREIAELRKLEPLPAPADHTHAWKVNVDGDTLTVACQEAGCPVGEASLSIVGEGFKVSDGTPLAVTVEGAEKFAEDTGATVGELVYKKGDEVLTGAPVEEGAYTANVSVTLNGQTTVLSKALAIHTHHWTVTLDGATFTATCANTDGLCAVPTVKLTVEGRDKKTADGKPMAVTLVGQEEFEATTGAKVELVYKKGDEVLGEPPVDVGDYTATVSVTLPGAAAPVAYEKAISVKERPAQQMAVYLKAGASGNADGTTWDDAFTDAATAFAKSLELDLPVYAAQGVYVVSETFSPSKAFAIYGGFLGEDLSETPDDRDVDACQTIFTGDQTAGQTAKWCHVQPDFNAVAAPTLTDDDTIIKDGKINIPAYTGDYDGYTPKNNTSQTPQFMTVAAGVGGTLDGIYVSGFGYAGVKVNNAYINGTLMNIANGAKAVTVTNCRFVGNYTSYQGGVYIGGATADGGSHSISGCQFRCNGVSNSGNVYNAIGICIQFAGACSATVQDCLFESICRPLSSGSKSGNVLRAGGSPASVVIRGCTFTRCIQYSTWNGNSGGSGNIWSAEGSCPNVKFLDSVVRNCYTACTTSGKGIPLMSIATGNSSCGMIIDGMQFIDNRSVVSTAADACPVMVGTAPTASSSRGNFTLTRCLFKGNSIYAASSAASADSRVALGIVGNDNSAAGMSLVNCVFDGNTATAAAGPTTVCSRGVICTSLSTMGSGSSGIGLANCTFIGSADGTYDVVQFGDAHAKALNIVNSVFEADGAMAASPFSFDMPAQVGLYSCSAKGMTSAPAGVATDPIPLAADYAPAARVWDIRATADVQTNALATANAPVTFSFKPCGETAYQALSPAQTTGTNKKGYVSDYAATAARPAGSFTRGAVQALTAEAENGYTVTVRPTPIALADAETYADSAAYSFVVPAGGTATVEAYPAEGRYFGEWDDADGELFSEDNPLVIPNLSSDLVLTAVLSETWVHRHNWSYAAAGAVLTATCSNAECDFEDATCKATLVCASKKYDEMPVAATIENWEVFADATRATAGEITYKQGDETLAAAPAEVGAYTASVTITTAAGVDYTLTAAFAIEPHYHDWSYAQKGAVLTATCAGGCFASPASVALVCPGEKVYDKKPMVAVISNAEDFVELTGAIVGAITYKQGGETLEGAPTEVGEYTASVPITVGGEDYTLTTAFEIKPHYHAWTYTTSGTTLTATCSAEGCYIDGRSVTVSLIGASTKFNDKDPGAYALTLEGLEDFAKETGATVDGPKYVLAASATTLPGAPSEAGAYYVELSVTPPGGEAITVRKDFWIEEKQTGVCLKEGATGEGTGVDWDNAYTDFSAALAAAVAKGLPLRVAQGVYDVTEPISLPDGFNVEGGYEGKQGDYTRDIDEFQTIICGDQKRDNVWWRFTPDESTAKITTAATKEPVIKNGKFNDPVKALGYEGAYDGFFTVGDNTETKTCFTITGNVGGTLDGIYIVGFGQNVKSSYIDGVVVQWKSKPTEARTVALKDLRVYGCMLAGAAFSQGVYDKLTTQMTGCRVAFGGADYSGGNVRYMAARICSLGYIKDCTFESLVRNTGSGNSVAFLRLESSTTGKPGVDLEGCTFSRLATCTSTSTLYGGVAGVVDFGGNSYSSASKFSDCTLKNCYVGSTSAGDHPLVRLANNYGWTGSNVSTGLRFEDNLQFLKTAEGASYVMIGTGYGQANKTMKNPFSIENSVFKGNRIKVLEGAANSAVGIVGGGSTSGGQFTLVNCVFDGNTVQSAVSGVTLSRGVICSAYRSGDVSVSGAFGLANCTFRSSGAGYDVLQWGAQEANANVVNCSFDVTDAQTYNPFGVAGGATSTVRLFSSTVKNCLDPSSLGVDDYDSAFAFDAIPLDADYRPLVRMPKIRETAAVTLNEAANGVQTTAGSGKQYPNTYSFKPFGASARQALCAAISTGSADDGDIGDLYGDSRTTGNTRGAVQRMDDLAESDEYAALVIRPRDVTVEGGVTTKGLSTASVSSEAMMVPKNGEVTIQGFRDTATKRVFAGWYNEDGSQYSPLNPLTLSELEDDLTLEARFMVRNGAAVLFF